MELESTYLVINLPGEKCIGLRGINPKLHHPSSKEVLHWNFNACVVAEGCLANGHTIILQPHTTIWPFLLVGWPSWSKVKHID